MVINSDTSSITIAPFVVFPLPASEMQVLVIHKATKQTDTLAITPTIDSSRATFSISSLPNVSAVAQNKDELIIRVLASDVLYYESSAYWIVGSTDINTVWKQFTTTENQTKDWITI